MSLSTGRGDLPRGWTVALLGDLLNEVDVRAIDVSGGLGFPVLSLTKDRGLIPQAERFDHRVARSDVSDYKVLQRGWIAYNPMVLWEGAIHALKRLPEGLVSPVYATWAVAETIADAHYVDLLLRSASLLREYERLASGV